MQKPLLIILNIIAASPVLIYPLFLITSIMAFDAPGSEHSPRAMITALVLIGFPVFIGVFIYLSHRYDSIPLALVACIPFIFLVYTFGIQIFVSNRKYDKAVSAITQNISKDFAYDPASANALVRNGADALLWDAGEFLSVDSTTNQIVKINPNASGSYFAQPVGKIQGTTLELSTRGMDAAKYAYGNFFNSERKTIFDLYTIVISNQSPGDFAESFNLEKYQLKK